ncbi:putative K(+) efflux antiporter KefB [Geobacter sp. OR-1]|uniref:monovalent cation:proton antiporter family protein n=1 Tax=Geobacter sp. OR-1 TaxID=1266765 RepID=UPI0005438179|nr:monovalent cation:proton antiporter family protein [Geobacter sp. OR-1]GAM08660.1 putative K(+) efflux antiporter KefB [Geobacter sp. OR-1]
MAVLFDLEILFGLAILTVLLVRRLALPSIIGFLAAGMIAGPHALALVKSSHQVEQMAEIGVVLLLFTIGIEFSLKELMRIRQMVFLGGGLQTALTIAAIAAIGAACGYSIEQAIFFGFLAALSSTAIIMKLLLDGGEMDTPHGKTTLGILIFQDLCVVPLMLLTPLLGGSGKGGADILLMMLKAAAVVVAAHYGARYLIPWILRQVVSARSRELFILTVIFIGFGTAWLTAEAGLSLALGAFIAGLAISESEYSQQVLGDIIPFRDAFMSLFFLSVGMLLDPAVLLKYPLLVAGTVVTIILVKVLVAVSAARAIGLPLRVAILSGLALAQIGEFSFVLSQTGLKYGLMSPDLYQLFLAASIATMALTPLCLRLANPLATFAIRRLPSWLTRGNNALAGRERRSRLSGHVLIAGYGLNGRNLAKVLKNLEIPHLIVDTNPFTISSERKRGEKIIFGDASQPEVLEHGRIAQAKMLVIAISDAAASRRIAAQARQMNPSIHIIARTRYLLEVEPLYRLGVNEVIPEEFETSVEILSRVLRTLLVPQDEIEQHISEVRRDGYGMLRSVSRRHSHAVGISGYLAGAEIATFKVGHGSLLAGESLSKGTIRSMSGATVLVIKRKSEVIPNPDPVWELKPDDIVLLLGSPEQLAAAGRLFTRPA